MLAVVKSIPKENHIAVATLPNPEILNGWVRVKVDLVGICGSDLHTYHWTPDYQVRYANCLPVVLGHEYTGMVEETGPGVKQIQKGDRVVSRTPISCGQCHVCLSGQEAICDHRKLLGVHYNGAMAEQVAVPAQNCHVLDDTYPPQLAALSEPISIAYGAVHKAGSLLGKNVVVIGPGPIGYFISLLSKLSGAARLYVLGLARDKARFDIFKDSISGLQTSQDAAELEGRIRSRLFSGGVDVVFEASGSAGGLQTALNLVRKRGLIVQVGIVSKSAEVNTNLAVRDEITIIGTPAIPQRLWVRMLDFLSLLPGSEQAKFEKAITGVLSLEKADQAFDDLAMGRGMKIMLRPTSC
jgi:threonine dehydrogenase-like Zn-dependent dehydrogenase